MTATLWTPDGTAWTWSPTHRLYECQCKRCLDHPAGQLRETFADLVAACEYVSDWSPADAAEMSHEKQTGTARLVA